ncbi:pectate lyase [Novosphingobium sp. MW5]|nr:pectate lyase [Novosphingobium sp. MW5]
MNRKTLTAIGISAMAFALAPVPPISVQAKAAEAPAKLRWGTGILRQSDGFYGSPQGLQVADAVLRYQSAEGGWPKNLDLTVDPGTPENLAKLVEGKANTIDNGGTTMPIRYLARVNAAHADPRYRAAVERGLDYLFAAQYPNGGWPQFFPLLKGYYSNVTFNDDAMVHVLELLLDVAHGQKEFAFVDTKRRTAAAVAVRKGLDVILRTQLKVDGKLAGWCAQYDPQTLNPAWARKYEPPSISGGETVGIVRFLMKFDATPEIAAAIDGAVQWLDKAAVQNVRVEDFTNADGQPDRRVIADKGAPRIWARFYELETSRPIFLGRDSAFHYTFGEIERERRTGYGYYGNWAEKLIAQDYPAWKARKRKR